jgi:hypothetical protein
MSPEPTARAPLRCDLSPDHDTAGTRHPAHHTTLARPPQPRQHHQNTPRITPTYTTRRGTTPYNAEDGGSSPSAPTIGDNVLRACYVRLESVLWALGP